MPTDATSISDQLVLGRYRILEQRGKGGFGTVYVCWDPRLMRRVAIKAIPLPGGGAVGQAAGAVPGAYPGAPGLGAPAYPGASESWQAGTAAGWQQAAPASWQGAQAGWQGAQAGWQAAPAGAPATAGYPGAAPCPGSPCPAVPEEPLDPEEAARRALLRAALAETRTASMLAHPSIVSVLDFESDAERAYIIMEYVEGASLAELLDATDDGLLTMDEAAAVADSVCDALQFAHDNGVLHLDIKPDNILIDMSGRVKLADFGMAALSSATGYAGARGGTVGYMPPEQIAGAGVDVRTDVFALACVMYEALTGVRPFAAPSAAESLALVERGAADPCALNESIPPWTADALLAALSPNPALRPVSASALGEELGRGLGRPKAGRKSLAAFVEDVLDDSPDKDMELGEGEEAWQDGAGRGGGAWQGGSGQEGPTGSWAGGASPGGQGLGEPDGEAWAAGGGQAGRRGRKGRKGTGAEGGAQAGGPGAGRAASGLGWGLGGRDGDGAGPDYGAGPGVGGHGAGRPSGKGRTGRAASSGGARNDRAQGRRAPAPRDGLGPASRAFPKLLPRALRVASAALSGLVAALATAALWAAVVLPGAAPAASGALAAGAASSSASATLAAAPSAGAASPAFADSPAGPSLVAGLAVLALGCAAPPLGSALALSALVAASCASGLWIAGLALAGAGAAWWALVARRRRLASWAAFADAPGALGAAPLAPPLAGWLLPAGPAALTALAGFLALGALACLAGASDLGSYSALDVVSVTPARAVAAFDALSRSPSFWLAGAGRVAAAAAMGALSAGAGGAAGGAPRGASKTRCYLGCAASGLTLAAFGLVICRMENGGSWQALPPGVALGIAASTILAALLVFLFGSPRALGADGRG